MPINIRIVVGIYKYIRAAIRNKTRIIVSSSNYDIRTAVGIISRSIVIPTADYYIWSLILSISEFSIFKKVIFLNNIFRLKKKYHFDRNLHRSMVGCTCSWIKNILIKIIRMKLRICLVKLVSVKCAWLVNASSSVLARILVAATQLCAR